MATATQTITKTFEVKINFYQSWNGIEWRFYATMIGDGATKYVNVGMDSEGRVILHASQRINPVDGQWFRREVATYNQVSDEWDKAVLWTMVVQQNHFNKLYGHEFIKDFDLTNPTIVIG